MKKNMITVLTLLAIPWNLAKSQHLDFEVSYELSTHTTYKVQESDLPLLLPQDTIKLIPESRKERIREQFFDDGTSRTESVISYPIQLLEEWIEPVDSIITTESRIDAFNNGELLYTEDLNSSIEYEPTESFAPFYLATNNWQLPLDDNSINDFLSNGYDIIENTATKLSIMDEQSVLDYDKNNLSETFTKLDNDGNEVSRKIVFYTPDESGYLLYDLIVTTTIDTRTHPCIEKTTYQDYTNIERVFHNPTCAPTVSNGYTSSQVLSIQDAMLTASQIEGTNTIYISLPPDLPNFLTGVVKDTYGGVVIDAIIIDTSAPYIDLGQLPTGVYHLSIMDYPTMPCKFLFKP